MQFSENGTDALKNGWKWAPHLGPIYCAEGARKYTKRSRQATNFALISFQQQLYAIDLRVQIKSNCRLHFDSVAFYYVFLDREREGEGEIEKKSCI